VNLLKRNLGKTFSRRFSSSKLALSRKAAKPAAVAEAGAGGFGFFVFGDEAAGEGGHGLFE